jgi:type IX secretion system PorP/SprF family membrane protein
MKTHFKCLFFLMLLIAQWGRAQETSSFSFYRNNWQMINPAAANHSWFFDPAKSYSINASYRQQWIGAPGSPANYNIHFESVPAAREQQYDMKMGGGMYGESGWDVNMPIFKWGGYGNYAYALPLNGSYKKLTLGLNIGFSNQRINLKDTRFKDMTDEKIEEALANYNGILSRYALELNAGAFYSDSKHFYAGVSAPFALNLTRLPGDDIGSANSTPPTALSRRPLYVNGLVGGAIIFDENSNGRVISGLYPSMWVRWQPNYQNSSLFGVTPISADVNLRYQLNSQFWLGTGYNTAQWVHFECGILHFDNSVYGHDGDYSLSLGLAYDMPLTPAGWRLGQTLELTVGFTWQ